MKLLKTLLLISTITFSFTACAASFDCGKATTETEKMICADESLSKLDSELNTAYKNALEKITGGSESTKQDQKKWLKEFRNVCKDAACLTKAYSRRIEQLNEAAEAKFLLPLANRIENQKLPLTFKLVFSKDDNICKPYVDMLNAAKYMEYPACERKLLPEFPQFKAVEWTEITNKDEMLKVMEKNISILYASRDELNTNRHLGFWRYVKKSFEEGKMNLHKTDIDINNDGSSETVYKTSEPRSHANAFLACNTFSVFYVYDKSITLENAKDYRIKRYNLLGMGDDNFLNINGKIFQDFWTKRIKASDIELHEFTDSHNEICGIKIQ